MKKIVSILSLSGIILIAGYIYYYITLPAVNIHSPGFWFFLIGGLLIASIVTAIVTANFDKNGRAIGGKYFKNNVFSFLISTTAILFVVYIIGSILSSPMINANKYQKLISVTERNFTDDIKEISYKEIPILDKNSAVLLGSRKMGSMLEYVSQFEVANNYTQINYEGVPIRVTPLEYGNFFKWLSNYKAGIPAYMSIDMATQEVNLVKLPEGIKYSQSDRFGRNINRYLRFRYPTYIFDDLQFEIDDNGTPYWICPVKDYTIGLFGGQTVGKVVTVNAVTGEHTSYNIGEVPVWIDRVFSADLLIELYDYYGTLKHGYLNSKFGQKDALQTTDGYNYIALEDDVWIYTGVTSVGGDESNVGFVLMNQRTAETRYYSIAGAEEYSAMASAEGQVQHLNYKATFPLLLNIGGEPTYFIPLKDAAGLVKKYALVNIEQYQIVAIGDTILEAEKIYLNLTENVREIDTSSILTITGTITTMVDAVIDGNSHYYILLHTSEEIFDITLENNLNIIRYKEGDSITFTYTQGITSNTVIEIK